MFGRMTKVKKSANVSYEAALEQFLIWEKAQGISGQTMKNYREYVNRSLRRYSDAYDPHAGYRSLEIKAYMIILARMALNLQLIIIGLFITVRSLTGV
jgi:hypothetical protein